MDKNLKLSFVALIVISCLMIAWQTLYVFFGGMGLNIVVMLVALAVVIFFVVKDDYVRNRVKDLLILAILFTVMEAIVFCAYEFGWAEADILVQIFYYQIFLSIVGFVFFAYTIFRLIYEACDLRYSFIETILGNQKRDKKVKQKKEFTNGSLEEKPNKQRAELPSTDQQEGEE